MEKKGTKRKFIFSVIVAFVCIVVNCIGREAATVYQLPGWLDTFGTFFSAYTLGPVPGAIVGVSANIIIGLWTHSVFAYSIVSIFIGVAVGLMARRRYFDTLFHTMTVAGFTSIGAVVISTVINLIIADGNTGNIWGNGVKDMFMESGWNKYLSSFVGELYLEFPDKLLAAMCMYLIVKLVRRIRTKGRDKDAARASVAAASVIALLVSVFVAPVSIQVHAAQAQQTSDEETNSYSYIQTVFNGTNGLACGHANAVAQTNDGVMWIGTYAGLYRYNGTEFKHMIEFEEIKNVNYLYVDGEGRLWVGTNDNGVVIVINEKVTNVIKQENGLPSNSIRSIVQSASGEYYVGTASGVVSIELKLGITVKKEIPNVGYVNSISADTTGYVAAVSSEGGLFIMKDNQVVARYENGTLGSELASCNFASDGSLYAGTADGKILVIKIDSGKAVVEKTYTCKDIVRINGVYPEIDRRTWICADNGIGYVDEKGNFTKQESGDFDQSVKNMMVDYQGNLWFASLRLGLLRLSGSSFTDLFADCGIQPSVVNTTAIDGDLLYVGADNGLIMINLKTRKRVSNGLTDHYKGVRIRCVRKDKNNNVWISTFGKGLAVVDRQGTITDYTEKYPEIGDWIRITLELEDGTVAVSASDGIFFIKDGKISSKIAYDDNFGLAQALCFLQTSDGTLYAGTDGNGIAVIKNGKAQGHITREDGLTSEVILRMVQDPEDNMIYIVTSNSICTLSQDGKVSAVKAFPYSNNYDVMIDNSGDLLVTGSAGIYVVDKKELLEGKDPEFTILDSRSGLVGSLTANSWNSTDKNRNVYLSSDRGVFVMNLDNYLLRQKSFRIMLTEMRLDDKISGIDRDTDLAIDRDVHKVEFFPEIINYTHDDPMVSYYLEGFEKDWTNVRRSELLSVQYTNLDPGSYTFHLAIRDDGGNIIEESQYRFHKEKAIYDNGWFMIYVIGVAGVFVGWLTWFITRTRIQRTLELQQTKLSMALQQVQMGNETILAIAKTVDAKDLRTSKHSQRVSEYSAMIAHEYGFTDDEVENLRKAALLHDIGKIGIPDSVLNKPARLTDEEYAVMKTHVTRGAEILKDFTLIDHVVEGARFHHERYDGRGYPDGLEGEEIPLYGRIIAIADAFDAMTANRVYRKRQDFDYVMGELHKGRGTQFDPQLLDIFLKLIDDKKIDIDALYKGEHQKDEEEQQ